MFLSFEEFMTEATVRVVRTDASGQRKISRVRDRATRQRHATQTTGRSKADRKLSARRAAKTRKRDATGTRKAIRKRRVTMRRRKAMGVK